VVSNSGPSKQDAHVPTEELVERWRSGDQRAADELHRRYAQRLCQHVERLLASDLRARVGASDVVQSAFRSFFRRTREGQYQVDHSSDLWRLLLKIALRKVLKQAERHRAGKRDVGTEEAFDDHQLDVMVLANGPSPEEVVAFYELLDYLLAGLNAAEQEIVQLRVAGYSTAEIAAKLRCSRWTVRRVLARVEARLGRWQKQDQ